MIVRIIAIIGILIPVSGIFALIRNNRYSENIPLEARIMPLADVFDALVSKRCYKDAFTYDKAFSIIEEGLGTQFDPVLGRLFSECRPELEKL